MTNFRPIDRATPYLLAPSVEDWLPKDHLARFVVDIVDQLDMSALTRQYRGTGSARYHPTVMLGLLVYGYATGVYSSRRIEAAMHDSIAVRYIAANQQPDHDSHLPQALFAGADNAVRAGAGNCPADEVAQA